MTEPAPAGTGLTRVGLVRQRTRASDEVHAELVDAIRTLRLEPGRDISEKELTDALGVSRTPVREALSRLADSGLVVVAPQVGTRIALISLTDVREAQFIRESLELGAISKACALPVRDVSGLRAGLEEQAAALEAGDVERFMTADEHFHDEIFALSGHAEAWRAVRPTKLQLDRIRRLTVPELASLDYIRGHHVDMTDAIEQGDVDAAREVGALHFGRILDFLPAIVEAHPEWVTD